jgi:hypothetical protein
MPRGPSLHNRPARKAWLGRLDQVVGSLNVLLVVIAIGLATLDLTCLFSEQIIDYLPQMARAFDVGQPTASPGWSTDQTEPP